MRIFDKNNYCYFICILKGYINNTSVNVQDNIDYLQLFQLAEIHNVIGILTAINRKHYLGFPIE